MHQQYAATKSTANKTHRCDMVFAEGNEESFINAARELRYREIIFISRNIQYHPPKDSRIIIKTAYLAKDVSEIRVARKRFDYVCAYAERAFFEQDIDFLLDAEYSSRKQSYHYIATSLNQVHAKFAQKNNITLVFGFRNILCAKNISFMLLTLSRMFQNAMIIRKYHLKATAFSMAHVPDEMRSRTILDALLEVLRAPLEK